MEKSGSYEEKRDRENGGLAWALDPVYLFWNWDQDNSKGGLEDALEGSAGRALKGSIETGTHGIEEATSEIVEVGSDAAGGIGQYIMEVGAETVGYVIEAGSSIVEGLLDGLY